MNRIAVATLSSFTPIVLCEKNSNKINAVTHDESHLFYKKHLNCKGINIHGSKEVNDTAFHVACERLLRMTRHANYNVHNNLIKNNVDFRLIGINESMTDLPEHSHMKNVEGGYSGKGAKVDNCRGMRHGSSVFCSEENLIKQCDKSKYSPNTKDIFIHETAHAIMGDGLDKEANEEIKKAWENAKTTNLWKNQKRSAYALTNPGEYFAELSMWYFGGHGDFIDKKNKIPKPGPGGLVEHDNFGFKVLSNIYGGISNIKTKFIENENTENIINPATGFRVHTIQSYNGPMKTNKVSLNFKLNDNEDDSDYLINWVNYKGEIKWGFKINKSCPYFKTNTFTGHAWLVQKAVLKPRYYLFGPKVIKYYKVKAFIANEKDGTCMI